MRYFPAIVSPMRALIRSSGVSSRSDVTGRGSLLRARGPGQVLRSFVVRRAVLLFSSASVCVGAWLVGACGASSTPAIADAGPGDDGSGVPPVDGSAPPDSAPPAETGTDDAPYDGPPGPASLRVAAANLTSGSNQSYDPGEGIRILQGLKPDVVLLQEFNYGANTDADARTMVDLAFGASFSYFRETGAQIPNAVISRLPIAESGSWTDPAVANRSFAYAKIALPGPLPLWAVSMHLLTTSATNRDTEAAAVVAQVGTVVPKGDYLVLGGDFNTDVRTEPCITTFSQIVVTAGPYPADGAGNDNTSGPRTKPHDWLLAGPSFAAYQVPTVIGADNFANGLVFDSRVYTPLADVAPVMMGDSAATNMQHMAVVKDFHLP